MSGTPEAALLIREVRLPRTREGPGQVAPARPEADRLPEALELASELRRPEQQRIDAREIDVGQRHFQRVAGVAVRAVCADPC